MNSLLNKITWNFIKERTETSISSYILSLEQSLNSFSPKTVKDVERVRLAKRDLHELKLGVKRLSERVSVLEEQVKVLEEEKKVLEELKNKEIV